MSCPSSLAQENTCVPRKPDKRPFAHKIPIETSGELRTTAASSYRFKSGGELGNTSATVSPAPPNSAMTNDTRSIAAAILTGRPMEGGPIGLTIDHQRLRGVVAAG